MPCIQSIVEAYLRAHNHDGLSNPEIDCGCGLDDFMPCGEPHEIDCVPGKRVKNGEGEWIYVPAEE